VRFITYDDKRSNQPLKIDRGMGVKFRNQNYELNSAFCIYNSELVIMNVQLIITCMEQSG